MADTEKLDRAEMMHSIWEGLTDEEYYQRCDNITAGLKSKWKNRTKEERDAIARKKRETWRLKAASKIK